MAGVVEAVGRGVFLGEGVGALNHYPIITELVILVAV